MTGQNASSAAASLAAVNLVASLTQYGYFLRAWAREALHVFALGFFFRMHTEALSSWIVVIDHLMARDNNALPDFLKTAAKTLSTSQTSGSLLQSAAARARDLDVARARVVKRLAFILYAGKTNQYMHVLPQVQVIFSCIHSLFFTNRFLLFLLFFWCSFTNVKAASPSLL